MGMPPPHFFGESSEEEECDDDFTPESFDKMEELKKTARFSSDDFLTDLVSLQGARGNFRWGLGLSKALNGKKEKDLLALKPENASDAVWISAVAAKVLEKLLGGKSSEEKQTWDLVLQKAKNFIKAELKNDQKTIDSIMEKASIVVA